MKLYISVIVLLLIASAGSSFRTTIARRSVLYHDVDMKQFSGAGFTNLSSMLVRKDIGQLLVGGREMVLSLSLEDISKNISEARWLVTPSARATCLRKGKDNKDCNNFIKALHKTDMGNMLVCGTNAFRPLCDHMTFKNGHLVFEKRREFGKGKVPFDPNQHYSSLMVGNTLYSATHNNFWGTQLVFQKSTTPIIRTELLDSWMNKPTFVSLSLVETSRNSEDGEDDSVFLFFTEMAQEIEGFETRVSRIARVCKGDIGGPRTLMWRWTSFLKARLDCPLDQPSLPSLVQDVFLLKDPHNWRESIFYATFTSQCESSETCVQSAVCAYKLSDISKAFSGRFMIRQRVGWSEYKQKLPKPRPGACINDAMRASGVKTSLDLPEDTLQFSKDHHLMATVVQPLTGGPLLVQSGTQFTKIVVDRVTAYRGQQHDVMFIGTGSGWLQKAVKFDGEDGRIIEELQLFKAPHPVNFLQLSSTMGQLYTGFNDTIVQLNVHNCSRYTSCEDCVLARDPYCGWDLFRGLCAPAAGSQSGSLIQRLLNGNIAMCPNLETELKPVIMSLTTGISQLLPCSPNSNLPVIWQSSCCDPLPDPRHTVLTQGLFISRPSASDAGLYTCETVETMKGKAHHTVVVRYLLQVEELRIITYLKLAVLSLIVLLVAVVTGGCIAGRRRMSSDAARRYNIENSRHCVIEMGDGEDGQDEDQADLVPRQEARRRNVRSAEEELIAGRRRMSSDAARRYNIENSRHCVIEMGDGEDGQDEDQADLVPRQEARRRNVRSDAAEEELGEGGVAVQAEGSELLEVVVVIEREDWSDSNSSHSSNSVYVDIE